MFASFVDHPHQLAEGGVVLGHDVKRERSRGGDDRVGGGTAEHVDDGGVGLVEGEDDSVQVVEGTGKKGNDQLDRVGQVDGHAVATLVDKMLADEVDLPSKSVEMVLFDVLGALDGEDTALCALVVTFLDAGKGLPPDIPEITITAPRPLVGAGVLDV